MKVTMVNYGDALTIKKNPYIHHHYVFYIMTFIAYVTAQSLL